MIELSLTLEFRDLSLQGGLPVSLLVVANYASTKLQSTYMDDLRIKLDPTQAVQRKGSPKARTSDHKNDDFSVDLCDSKKEEWDDIMKDSRASNAYVLD